MTRQKFLTVGHSTHDGETFARLLLGHGVTAVADVRSTPFSRFTPQFNRRALARDLPPRGISYVFLGDELGARPSDPGCYVDGKVQYARLAATEQFTRGIQRLARGATSERIAIMCAEGEPLDCHRTVLVSRVLVEGGAAVQHLHGDGSLESHADAMLRLMGKFGLADDDLFRTHDERLNEALKRQEERIAHVGSAP
ncbi:DUF488 domain-containing protein [Lentzea sp. BCCO 10_0798]|uniref:DUF488 domain-containing protein n=1 Tax=Lentzea kristufekii TaxID=3095430 RepID=A0ABU4U5Z6_9PSEU|nr:DUF488 domain-containing protein [Lentzea sp. BCCO 10_0798]MDX8055426.1 DUF488 domain-containing protein [Lentzea sp. BCCO 10_0798]